MELGGGVFKPQRNFHPSLHFPAPLPAQSPRLQAQQRSPSLQFPSRARPTYVMAATTVNSGDVEVVNLVPVAMHACAWSAVSCRPPVRGKYAPNQVIFFRTSSAGQANMIVESNTAGPTTARSL